MNNGFIKIEAECINCIIESHISVWVAKEYTMKLKNNGNKIICEYLITKKLENKVLVNTLELIKTIEIEYEVWDKIINKLLKIINQRKYKWDWVYSVGRTHEKDAGSWKIQVINKNGKIIEIKSRYGTPQLFERILSIFSDIYYKNIKEKE